MTSELLTDPPAPAGEDLMGPMAQVRLQALADAVPVALMEFRLQDGRLRLLAANAAARRMPGLGAVRTPGVDASEVFDLLADTPLMNQLLGVVRVGAPLECRQVVREPGRLLLAWDLTARRVADDSIMVTVRDAGEAEALRAALAASERSLEEVRRELREQTEVFNTTESLARTGHWRRIEDPGETVLLWSPGLCEIAGFEQQEWVDSERAVSGILPEDRHVFSQLRESGKGLDVEYRWRRPDGAVRWMRSRVQRALPRDGVQVVMGVVQDVTDEHRAAEQLREQLLFIQRIASRIPGFIYEFRLHCDGAASVQYISDAVREFMGVEPQEVTADHGVLMLRVLAEDRPQLRRSAIVSVRRLVPWQCEYRVRMPDGTVRWHMTNAVPHREPDGSVVSHGFTMDITERKRAEQEIERLAFYDALTGLPNRRLLLDRLQRAIVTSLRTRALGALLFIDLDNFKDLNDTLGHDMGDQLLSQVAARLVGSVREADTVARFGGDEFVVMLQGLAPELPNAATQAETVAEKLLASLNQPFDLDGQQYYSTPSIGVTLFGDERLAVDELLKRADLAMYQAKAAGRNTLRFFDPDMQAAVNARSHLEAELRQGLARAELLVYYQPVVDRHARLIGAEALVRWRHPRRGMIGPGEFIPLAEQTGLIFPLGQYVLQHACAQLQRWGRHPDTAALSISVNVSARQFRQPGFVAQVLQTLKNHGADPRKLKLELTESLLLGDIEDTIARMGQLKNEGVGFALDDFGTGYSSLSYLKRLPLDQVKIDQSFVREVLANPNDAAIVRTILTLAKSLDLQVVAEGVETTGQLSFLRRHGCEAFQGYLFGRAGPVEDIDAFFYPTC
ncbi:putative bifunctional diguanylate cyclase/phosphodiesterase [Verminephrobacter aporrectodeae]|uniref:EAL domain-containing protein n=1 Tax=Verminephrobacter aporrectodeae subsp. tuberculatae TaxID=1110392 RepID=A0ABT3KWF8_9BURK|nr:EAL domain-containing protein [Verminephrobacter aporrectodeae]MCW5322674.1 EAL domain-containing protein [Verminephrobacter aporrectodeae subsp. tuberculatae]MCW8176968.1 EAL domain-containing protein [Verminephrobacter aporrectodeae subsp. tuberculatae]MCW8198059.1 EAL domain-containing protein [Verminephrobacter aporrectodeae subsp. tuberculatae]MCW8202547.1 EAL domain-containing protein [Verminephrobacter aporrectodeae subsp. tuberculatae]